MTHLVPPDTLTTMDADYELVDPKTPLMEDGDDPNEVIRKKLTPRALKVLSDHMESHNENTAHKAAIKVLEYDKRIDKAVEAANQSINLIGFNPEYLGTALKGLQTVLTGEDNDEKEDLPAS